GTVSGEGAGADGPAARRGQSPGPHALIVRAMAFPYPTGWGRRASSLGVSLRAVHTPVRYTAPLPAGSTHRATRGLLRLGGDRDAERGRRGFPDLRVVDPDHHLLRLRVLPGRQVQPHLALELLAQLVLPRPRDLPPLDPLGGV